MGKATWERQLHHFSHRHPLELTNLEEPNHQCTACLSPATGWLYRCNICNFDLHLTCSQIPLQITHPADPHVLNLLSKPAYHGSHFVCDACGCKGRGFSFHCALCQKDLHPFPCANLPLRTNTHHHPHALALSFKPPYPNNIFSCDACGKPGKDTWHYHCSLCLFDAHVTCATSSNPHVRPPPKVSGNHQRPSLFNGSVLGGLSRSLTRPPAARHVTAGGGFVPSGRPYSSGQRPTLFPGSGNNVRPANSNGEQAGGVDFSNVWDAVKMISDVCDVAQKIGGVTGSDDATNFVDWSVLANVAVNSNGFFS